MATSSPKRIQRVQPRRYSTCLLYNTKEATEKLKCLQLASCNPQVEHGTRPTQEIQDSSDFDVPAPLLDGQQLSVSDKMSCNFCDATFLHRIEQKRHYRSDWHRYNLKQRIKAKPKVTEEQFEEISGNISSLSGSDSDSDSDTDSGAGKRENKPKLVPGMASQLRNSAYSSTDSESDAGNQILDRARRLPKLYFRNWEGELLSVYRCVVCHKKEQPARPEELITMVTDVLGKMNWAVFMVGGGHFAAAIYNKDELVAHKTFHRYVVRAKRGTAQSSRDNQGGSAIKSAGASLRRYNEAALTQDIQDLISSWSQHMASCDRIFLRAPSFNRKIFFGGKTPPLNKDDPRIRLIPFQTRRPTFNEVRRVFETLASIECYGDESELQDLIPISPPQVFDPESGQLTVRDESQMTPKQRKILNKKLRSSPLVTEEKQASSDTDQGTQVAVSEKLDAEIVRAVPEHVFENEAMSSGASTGSDVELLETLETMNMFDHKEFHSSKKPKRRKKTSKQRRQTEPESNVMDEEKYHLKNSLYTACKVGDAESLKNLLAIFIGYRLQETALVKPSSSSDNHTTTEEQDSDRTKTDDSGDKVNEESKTDVTAGSDKSADFVADITRDSVETSQDCDTVTSNGAHMIDKLESDKSVQVTNSETMEDLSSEPTKPFDKDTSEHFEKASEVKIPEHSDKDLADRDVQNTQPQTDESNKPEVDESKTLSPKRLALSVGGAGKVQLQTALPDMSPVVNMSMLNESFGDNTTTLLHVAAREGHKSVVAMLLEAGADPAHREKTGHTPYMVSKDKATRNEFRKYMGKLPDKYDYNKAQIPAPLTDDMEAEKKKKDAEKKKAAKKVRQEKMKVQREENAVKQAEERDKHRFLNLSDREKRALAAERRLVSQVTTSGGDKPVLVRCFQCGSDMTGKTPFEYYDNKFCTSKCLQHHRKAQVKS